MMIVFSKTTGVAKRGAISHLQIIKICGLLTIGTLTDVQNSNLTPGKSIDADFPLKSKVIESK